jgi:hypothetical protein
MALYAGGSGPAAFATRSNRGGLMANDNEPGVLLVLLALAAAVYAAA